MINDCTAIILAGGESQRMGLDKANMRLGDQTLLQHVIAIMQQIFPSVIVSVRQRRPEINLLQVCDICASEGMVKGPLAGLASSMAQISTRWAFVVACDMPFVTRALVEYLAKQREACQAVVPVVQGHPQPLAAFYASTCLGTIQKHIAEGGKNSLRAVLEKLKVRYVDETELLKVDPALRSFLDLDTPQDIAVANYTS